MCASQSGDSEVQVFEGIRSWHGPVRQGGENLIETRKTSASFFTSIKNKIPYHIGKGLTTTK